MTMWLYSTGLL